MIGNPLIFLGAAIIPMLVGSIWYGPLFGKAWMSTNGFTEEDLKGSNMLLILGLSFLLSVILAAGISGLTVHQSAIAQLFAMHPDFETAGTEVNTLFTTLMNEYGDRHRTFGHGVVHGIIGAVMFALPLITINALFERRGAKYIFIHFGYWLVTFSLMSGVICQFF